MKNFKSMTIALGLTSIFAFGACGGDAMSDAKKFADELCACKDMACVEKVSKNAKKSMDEEAMNKLAKDHPEEMAETRSSHRRVHDEAHEDARCASCASRTSNRVIHSTAIASATSRRKNDKRLGEHSNELFSHFFLLPRAAYNELP